MGGSKSTRRQMLAGAAATAAAICCGDHVTDALALDTDDRSPTTATPSRARPAAAALTVADGLSIHRRDEWGADLPPTAHIPPEEVKFLLVHHSASSFNTSDPRSVIRSIYAFHTGPEKRWQDVAYNFFVAPDGSVWEGRAGSLDGPVEASATGGNQGYSQLVCLLGNHVAEPPTAAAQDSLVRILAWLAGRYDLGTFRDASTTFVSRGSDKFPAGATIITPVISPHRAVTYTACPGDAAVALLPEWRRRVHQTLATTWERDGMQPARRVQLQAP
jgi:N-acetylmuramoyl-L-alanine amidase